MNMKSLPSGYVAADDDLPLPGFRFHPTEEELHDFYRRRLVGIRSKIMERMRQLGFHTFDPYDLPKDEAERAWPPWLTPLLKSDYFSKTSSNEDLSAVSLEGLQSHATDEELVELYPIRKVVTSSTSKEIFKQADIYKYDPMDLPKYSAFRDYLEEAISETLGLDKECLKNILRNQELQHMAINYYPACPEPELTYGIPPHTDPMVLTILLQDMKSHLTKGSITKRGRKFRSILRPNRVTGSGFWKATGIDMPIHASNVKTGSANNRWETLQTHTSILDSMDYHQWQQYELLTNVGPGYRNGYGYNSSGGETSTTRHHSYVPQVHIDIFDGIDQIMVENGNNGHTYLAIYQAWNEYKNRLKVSKFDDDAMKMMSGIFVAVAGQFIAGVMANRLTSSASSSSWAAPIVELATVFGLCITLLGISLRAKSRHLSTLMIKIGAVTTAGAIIFSMGAHLPPVMAWTVGPVAFLIMALAAAFA